MVPIPGIGYYIFLVLFGITLVLPYATDRLLTPRLAGIAATLGLPATWALSEYLVSFGRYGTWGSTAYSQYGSLALLQLLSVTGLWGIASRSAGPPPLPTCCGSKGPVPGRRESRPCSAPP